MIRLSAAILSVVLVFISVPVTSQESSAKPADTKTKSGKSSEPKPPGPVVLDPNYVLKFREMMKSPKTKAWDLQTRSRSANGPELEELRLLVGEALIAKGFSLAAQAIYLDVARRAIGTTQGVWALHALDQLAKINELDDQMIEEFSYEYDGNVDGNSERSMLAYFRARALLRRGYIDWATKELAKVSTDTQWHAERLFERAAEVLADGRNDEAEALYEDLIKRDVIRLPTKQFAHLNRARLVFERGNYDEVLEVVRSVDLPMRERARALLEMAWSRYYLKEYSRALGILKVIDSAFFQMLRSPEADLLRMVIERDLCRYDLIKESAASFRERYKVSFKQIESRMILERDGQLKQLALQGRNLQKRATLIHRYRTEIRALEDEDFRAVPGLREAVLKNLRIGAMKSENAIARVLSKEVEKVASQLIELRDQVTFLEYEASIRPLTSIPPDEADYQPTPASKTSFDRLYWPVIDESWWDELDSYEVLIRARCAQPLNPSSLESLKKKKVPAPVVEEEEEEEEEEE
jgi:hypothetical protein